MVLVMDSGKNYEVKDVSLAGQGRLNIALAESRMAALMEIRARFAKEKPFSRLKIGMALHVTKETAVLARTLAAGGAEVHLTGCNPLSTQDDVAAALATEGIFVYGYKGETREDYYRYLGKVLECMPHLTIDDGADLALAMHAQGGKFMKNIIGGSEETTTGIIRLRAMEADKALKCPIIAVNDNKTKHLLDNYYGTGQSTLDGIMRASNVLFAGKVVVVAGYGPCGKGVALRASGMGARVIVCEVDSFRALQAALDGYEVAKMDNAAKTGDIFITVTGDKSVITLEHMKKMKDGAMLANSGHFDVEIDVRTLESAGKKVRIRPQLDEYTLNGKRIYLCSEGRLVNLAAAEGHPSEVMATSFAGQALAMEYLVKNKGRLTAGVHTLPIEIDDLIARLQLAAMGREIDVLTPEQVKYLSEWKEGT
jgi:adenosylhomocysteinase